MFFKIVNIFIIFNLLLFKGYYTNAKRRFSFEISSYTCQKLGNRLKVCDCSYEKFSKEHYAFTQKVQFDRDLGEELILRIWVEAMQPFSPKPYRFADIKMDACSALHHKFDLQFLKMVANEFKRATNLPSKCPFKGDVLYKMNNFSITTQYIPAYAPSCNFTFGVDFYDSKTLFGSVKVLGALVH